MNLELMRYVAGAIWAVPKDRLTTLWALITRGATSASTPPVEARRGDDLELVAVPDGRMQMTATIAVIPVFGEISPRATLFSLLFGGTTLDRLRAQFRKALGDDSVKAIVLRMDSPGGVIDGVPEMAAEVFAARGAKPIVAIADTLCASAAYWIGSQADQVVATPSAQVGSIGVLSLHEDVSKMLEEEGVAITLISSDEQKTAGNPFEPLSAEARADIQAKVDEAAGMFRADVARGRGITAKQVRETYGQGRVLTTKEAKAVGMIDRIETLDQLVTRLAGRRSGTAGARAAGTPSGTGLVAEWLAEDLAGEALEGIEPLEPLEAEVAAPALPPASTPDPRADYYRTQVAIAESIGRQHGIDPPA